ncbi:MAG: hypothetical protein IKJ45_17915, partial [Kiritimatiellae bacterium]|nr:hypothetical protein [Kiritimatiellia bacterium]
RLEVEHDKRSVKIDEHNALIIPNLRMARRSTDYSCVREVGEWSWSWRVELESGVGVGEWN